MNEKKVNQKKNIDCLLIGHNQTPFEEYERIAGEMGTRHGAYRDLNLSFIRYNDKPYTASGIFNVLNGAEGKYQPVKFGETFSAAVSYLGSYLQRHGLTFDYINSFNNGKAELAEKLRQHNVLSVAVITTLYVFALPVVEIIEFVRSVNPEVKIIVGGPYISTQVRSQQPDSLEYLFTDAIQADYFVNNSQGESTLVNIIHALKNNSSPEHIKNIYYKNNGALVSTPTEPEDNRLADNPVLWELFAANTGSFANVRTAISCPFSCSFCGFPQRAGKYQTMDVPAIEAQLNRLEAIGTVKSIHFIDDTFNVPPKRFKEILKMMIKNKYSFKWHSYYRCQFADREEVELMKESGCEGVFLGIESGNQQILQNMKKECNLDKYKRGTALLKEAGIVTFASFITGFPGETLKTHQDTVRFIKETGFDFYRSQLWYCEPITPIWQQKEKYGISGESFEWSHHTMDSQTGCELIEDMVKSIDDPIWIPQHDFDFDTIWRLVHQGMSMEDVKSFLRAFREGLKDKLANPAQPEAQYGVIRQIMDLCQGHNGQPAAQPDEEGIIDKYDAAFDF